MAVVNRRFCLFLLLASLPLSLISAASGEGVGRFDYAIMGYWLSASGQILLIALLVLVSGLYAGMISFGIQS